jgi:hypothetical protein
VMQDVEVFLQAAKMGEVMVKFKKAHSGEIREMLCTLNHVLSEGKVPEVFPEPKNAEAIAVWCLDKSAWRSFRKDSVIEWRAV